MLLEVARRGAKGKELGFMIGDERNAI